MGRHGDDTRQRGIAGWLIATAVGAVVVVALVLTYFIFLNSDTGAGTVDTRCTGDVRVEVAAGGSAAALDAAAEAFNAAGPAARGSCLTAHVSTIASSQVIASLLDGWVGEANPEPTVWIPDNPADLAAVAAAAPGLVAGFNDTVIGQSPVVLAVADRPDSAAAGFSWPDLLGRDTPVTLPGGGELTLALGDPRVDPATGYALESMLADPAGAPVTNDAVAAAGDSLMALTRVSTMSTSGADLLDGLSSATSTVTAVPVLESTLAQYNRRTGSTLRALYPTGPTAGDQLTGIVVSAPWVDVTEVEGGTQFLRFLSSTPGQAALRGADVRLPTGIPAAAANGIDPTLPVTVLPAADQGILSTLATAMGLPATPVTAGGAASGTAGEPSAAIASASPTS